MLFILTESTFARSYRLDVTGDAGGVVSAFGRSMNGSFELSGYSIGEGRFYRVTDIDVNDVRMKERISANEGSLDAEERIFLISVAEDDPESEVIKPSGSQTFSVFVEEAWPVFLNARRRVDYMGAGISDREAFATEFDSVSASYFRNTDLRRERSCDLRLNETIFTGKITDDPTEVSLLPESRVISNKSLYYTTDSISNGLATLGYRQVADDLSILEEGSETYSGSFRIARTISMRSPGIEDEDEEVDWLLCCPGGQPILEPSADEARVFEGF